MTLLRAELDAARLEHLRTKEELQACSQRAAAEEARNVEAAQTEARLRFELQTVSAQASEERLQRRQQEEALRVTEKEEARLRELLDTKEALLVVRPLEITRTP